MKNKSTYSLLLNADSEDKGSSLLETAIYSLVVLCMALSAWHFASTTVTVPGQNRQPKQTESMIANAPVPPAPIIASRG